MRFHHNQKMNIISGFYKGYKGKIKSFETMKDLSIIYTLDVIIDNKNEKIKCNEEELKPSMF